MRRFTYKGKYNPVNAHKYVGNVSNVTYRSMWERRFMKYCDMNLNVIRWSSEELIIPYYSPVDRKLHKYYPDFLLTVKTKDEKTKTMVIEVKPKRETKAPKKKKKVKRNITSGIAYVYSTFNNTISNSTSSEK